VEVVGRKLAIIPVQCYRNGLISFFIRLSSCEPVMDGCRRIGKVKKLNEA
jgi:hypothetical protein